MAELIPGLPPKQPFSVTSFLDPVFAPVAEYAGIPASELSTIFGTDAIAGGSSAIAKVVLTDSGRMAFNGFASGAAALYGMFGASGRGATDAWSLASHWLWDFILATTPGTGTEAQSLSTLTTALSSGDINAIQAALVKDPAQVQSLTSGWMNALNMGGMSWPSWGGGGSAPPAVAPPAPTSQSQAFVKRYV